MSDPNINPWADMPPIPIHVGKYYRLRGTEREPGKIVGPATKNPNDERNYPFLLPAARITMFDGTRDLQYAAMGKYWLPGMAPETTGTEDHEKDCVEELDHGE